MMAKTAIASSYFLSGSGSNSSPFRQAPALAFFYRPSDINKQSLKFLSGSRSYSSYLHVESCGYGRLSPSMLELGSPRRSNTSTGATHVNDAGSIDSPLMQSMEKKIKEHLSAESVSVKDAYGVGRHVSIDVVSSAFEGQSAVNRQRMVYKAILEELQSTVHAVDQMTTKTPSEAAAAK